jgi:glycosyltransferase involved in cell wall biosynthesis
MRILHVVKGMGRGGIETWLMNIFRNIDRQRYQFDFLTHVSEPRPFDEEIRHLGGNMLPPLSMSNPLKYVHDLKRFFKEYGPYDVIHAHGGNVMGLVLKYAEKAGIPIRIVHSHDLQKGQKKRFRSYFYDCVTRRLMFNYATVGLGCSSDAVAALFGKNWQRDPRFGVLLYGLDFQGFNLPENTRQEVRKELNIPLSTPVVGHVGRFTPEKNHLFFIQVAGQIARILPDVKFLLVGDGSLREKIEECIRKEGLVDKFILTGTRSDIPRLLQAMDVFLFTSRFEGLGLVLVEAQAGGLRCVVSDIVPQEADIIHEHVVRLSLDRPTTEWAGKVIHLLGMPRPESIASRKCVMNSPFEIQKAVSNLTKVYNTGCIHFS